MQEQPVTGGCAFPLQAGGVLAGLKLRPKCFSLQSLLLNGLLEQSLVIHNRCTADVISHPIHQSPHSIKLNLG